MTEKTILLVDDEADIRQVLDITLADMGYRVLTARNGEEAFRIFKENGPPVVLTDIKMPGIDGIRLLQNIKQEDPDTEVIMITGHGDMDLAIRSFQDNATDFITKPIDVAALETALKKAWDKIRIRQQLRSYTENLETLLFEKSKPGAGADAADQDLSDTPRRLQAALDQLPCYILIHDDRLIIVAANRRFQRDFGDTVGQHCYAACRDRSEPCPDCPVLKTFADGKSYQYDMEYILKDGVPKKLLAWTLPVLSSDGVPTQVMVMSTEVSRISELQDHLSSLGLMVGSLSHGIKGMLTGLDSGMYLLDSGLASQNTERTQEGLEVVKQTADRLKKMVLDILFYAKDRDLKKESMDVREFSKDVARTVEPKIRSHGIAFTSVFEAPLGTSEFDAGFLIQALVNIFENAMEACLEDASKPSHTIHFRVSSDSGNIRFNIRDDGIGMDPETRKNMFQLFFSSKGKKGTGLGLFITQKIIHQHGGDIAVRSTPGEGTDISVRIPKSQ